MARQEALIKARPGNYGWRGGSELLAYANSRAASSTIAERRSDTERSGQAAIRL
jgi:hypothetical protein